MQRPRADSALEVSVESDLATWDRSMRDGREVPDVDGAARALESIARAAKIRVMVFISIASLLS